MGRRAVLIVFVGLVALYAFCWSFFNWGFGMDAMSFFQKWYTLTGIHPGIIYVIYKILEIVLPVATIVLILRLLAHRLISRHRRALPRSEHVNGETRRPSDSKQGLQ
jgi:TRAP-type C4-dicarboxylate transport system permease small subunit